MVASSDSFYMGLAIEEAWRYQLLTYPNPAVGAAIVDRCGRVVAVSAHKEAGKAHAEVLAARDAYTILAKDESLKDVDDADTLHKELIRLSGDIFKSCTIYVTLEPCNHEGKTPPCSHLLAELGFKRVVIGADDPNVQASGGALFLKSRGAEVTTGVERLRCEELIEPFVKWSEGRFLFFKLAQTINGVIDGGTISSFESRVWVHKVRSKLDRVVIGGNTVRVDRPILDSRYVESKAPDISILTRLPETIDRATPLFGVNGREVEFINDVGELPDKGLVMAEGGGGTLEALRDKIDWMVLFVAPFIKEGMGYNGTAGFRVLHQDRVGKDIRLWLKAEDG
ncbi:MAG: bifunctional diaminohydroxyphosphoribosylaminopyrimidine deaminase/5-amino-6-(5-phosphoribosylamino)uracil reductase RibD [Hydrogenimonas sp.]|nr:bifunctional diaminohydroxyphosphoribosylaminopyrimidine deaminase/5-amino-6-(5-phosphoribosylamino)uracil reductase RibD [Hydrogenimonas sp.]